MTKHPVVVDMHWGALLGRGWTSADRPFNPAIDPVNAVSTTTSTEVASGGSIPVTSAAGFSPGMLICYLATDGEYYPAKLHSVSADPALTLGLPISKPIAAGAPIYSFYRDDAHPNTYGGATVADEALRQISGGDVFALEYRVKDVSYWVPLEGAAFSASGALDYASCGTPVNGMRGLRIDGPGVGSGAYSLPFELAGGKYRADIPVNCGLRAGGYSGHVQCLVDVVKPDGSTYVAGAQIIQGFDCAQVVRITFTALPGDKASVRLTSGSSGAWNFHVGPVDFLRKVATIGDVNQGKHVLLGDSWFSVGSAIAARLAARLDMALVVTKGIPGNRCNQLIDRFFTDVAPDQPDYVWVMVGTNDYYAGVTPETFAQQIKQLAGMIQGIGAQPIFFTPSVGALTFSPQQLTPSRTYAMSVNYHASPDEIDPVDMGAMHLALTMALADYVIETGDPAQTGGVMSARDLVVANS